MADFADEGSRLEERLRNEALAAQRAEAERQARIAESMRGYDPTQPRHCQDCDALIPPERLRLYPAAARCTACSARAEKRLRRLYG